MTLLTPRFSLVKVLRVKSQHAAFRLAYRDFPRVLTLMLSRRLVHTRGRYMISIGLLSSRVTVYLVSMHFLRERRIQVLLLFRSHGLSGSPDSLGQFKAYNMSPCRILGPMTLSRLTCRNLLFLASCDPSPRFRFQERSIDP
jgi:hypothetical protein